MNYYTRQDLNTMLYRALLPMKDTISGGIYIDDERPNNSHAEDVAINTPSITMDDLQQAYSNVNIYVPRTTIKGEDGSSRQVYNPRADELTRMAIDLLGEIRCNGIASVESEAEEGSPEGYEQFINIRIMWRILKND